MIDGVHIRSTRTCIFGVQVDEYLGTRVWIFGDEGMNIWGTRGWIFGDEGMHIWGRGYEYLGYKGMNIWGRGYAYSGYKKMNIWGRGYECLGAKVKVYGVQILHLNIPSSNGRSNFHKYVNPVAVPTLNNRRVVIVLWSRNLKIKKNRHTNKLYIYYIY